MALAPALRQRIFRPRGGRAWIACRSLRASPRSPLRSRALVFGPSPRTRYPSQAGALDRAVRRGRPARHDRARHRAEGRARASASRSSSRTAAAPAASPAPRRSRARRPTATPSSSPTSGRWRSTLTCTRSCSFDPAKDLTPVGLIATANLFLVANAGVPVKDFGELVALARAKPGVLNYGSSGIGSIHHLAWKC